MATKRLFAPTAIAALVAALAISHPAYAADTFSINGGHPTEQYHGTVRNVNAGGSYSIAPNEQIVDVRLYFSVINNFGYVATGGQVVGTWDSVHKTWGVQYGDYELYQYQIRISVSNGKQVSYYWTQVYTW
jgi:hypothetical protein